MSYCGDSTIHLRTTQDWKLSVLSNTPHFHAVSETSCVLLSRVCLNLDILSPRRCPEEPAIEITKIVDIDIATGEVNLPLNLR